MKIFTLHLFSISSCLTWYFSSSLAPDYLLDQKWHLMQDQTIWFCNYSSFIFGIVSLGKRCTDFFYHLNWMHLIQTCQQLKTSPLLCQSQSKQWINIAFLDTCRTFPFTNAVLATLSSCQVAPVDMSNDHSLTQLEDDAPRPSKEAPTTSSLWSQQE